MNYDPPGVFKFNNPILSMPLCPKQACIELALLSLKTYMHFVFA